MCTISQGLKWIKNGYNMIPAFKKYKLNEGRDCVWFAHRYIISIKNMAGIHNYVEKCYEERKERSKEGPRKRGKEKKTRKEGWKGRMSNPVSSLGRQTHTQLSLTRERM